MTVQRPPSPCAEVCHITYTFWKYSAILHYMTSENTPHNNFFNEIIQPSQWRCNSPALRILKPSNHSVLLFNFLVLLFNFLVLLFNFLVLLFFQFSNISFNTPNNSKPRRVAGV